MTRIQSNPMATGHIATSLRSNTHPLTLDQIRRIAPSAFATEPYHKVSSRYAYIPTEQVINGLMNADFQPFAVAQSRTRIEGKQPFAKHMIRFRTPNQKLALNEIFPEIVLINSHDGSSAYKLMAGLFRLVCSNGMIVADSMVGSISVRHSGNIIEEAATGSIQIVENMPKVVDAIDRWRKIQLNQAEQTIMAEAALQIKYDMDTDGKLKAPITPDKLLVPQRSEDTRDDLWSTFNRVQENLTRGGQRGVTASGRRTRTRAVTGIDQDVKLNRALWMIGEKMAAMKA